MAPASPSSGESALRPRRLGLLFAAYLLSAVAVVLSRDALATAPPRSSFDSRESVSRVVVGVSQARVATVRQVLAAEVTRPTPPPPAPTPALTPALAPAPYLGEVLGESAGAVQGIATWYGGSDGFGSEDTMADGAPFNPDDPTIAAANDWPLGAWLAVCHEARCIRVRVRDRGTFSHAVDLSRGAFAQLAPLSSGVIDVTVQPLS